jgi:hypothetical protein
MSMKKRYIVLLSIPVLFTLFFFVLFCQKKRPDRIQEYIINDFEKPLSFVFRCAYDESYFTVELQGEVDAEVRVVWGGLNSVVTENFPMCSKIDSLEGRRFEKSINYKQTVECTYNGVYQVVSFHPLTSTKGYLKIKLREHGYCWM